MALYFATKIHVNTFVSTFDMVCYVNFNGVTLSSHKSKNLIRGKIVQCDLFLLHFIFRYNKLQNFFLLFACHCNVLKEYIVLLSIS